MTTHRREHVPSRPTWRCRACGTAWPCGTAKLNLLAEYRGQRTNLLIYLATLRVEAADQLAESERHADPTTLTDRFTGWVPTRTT